jgi:HPr kinase/phosphorylase
MAPGPQRHGAPAGGEQLCLHASCIAWQGRGLLIRGRSGQGKSALALQLMAYGATLVADDRVLLRRAGGRLLATAPEPIAGLIEARGIGLLQAATLAEAEVIAVADLDQEEDARLPEAHSCDILGLQLPLLRRVAAAHFAPALLQYLKRGCRPL